VVLHPETEGFARSAGAYERGRPGYPDALVEWIVSLSGAGTGTDVVDLGAGTGKLTRRLFGTGAEVVAVEPVSTMRLTLEVLLPEVRTVEGTAESLPLPDCSADVVTVAQAFHWFANDQALTEISRVLRPRGLLILVWNRRDPADPLQAGIAAIVDRHRDVTPSYGTGSWRNVMDETQLFVAEAEVHLPNDQRTSRSGLRDRVASTSFVARLPDGERTRLLDEVVGLLPDGEEKVVLRYTTDAYAYRVR